MDQLSFNKLTEWRWKRPKNIFPRGQRKVRYEEKLLSKHKNPYLQEFRESLKLKEWPEFITYMWEHQRRNFYIWIGSWAIVLTIIATIATCAVVYSSSSEDSVTSVPVQPVELVETKIDTNVPVKKPPVTEPVVKETIPVPSGKIIIEKQQFDKMIEAIELIPDLKNALDKTTVKLEETTKSLDNALSQLDVAKRNLNISEQRYSELSMEHERLMITSKGMMIDYTVLQAKHLEATVSLRESERRYNDLIDSVFN